jgi:ribosomal protein S27E
MVRYFIPLRCPNCGETNLTETDNPLSQSRDTLYFQHSLTVKWAECNICGEIFPMPRNVREIKP